MHKTCLFFTLLLISFNVLEATHLSERHPTHNKRLHLAESTSTNGSAIAVNTSGATIAVGNGSAGLSKDGKEEKVALTEATKVATPTSN